MLTYYIPYLQTPPPEIYKLISFILIVLPPVFPYLQIPHFPSVRSVGASEPLSSDLARFADFAGFPSFAGFAADVDDANYVNDGSISIKFMKNNILLHLLSNQLFVINN